MSPTPGTQVLYYPAERAGVTVLDADQPIRATVAFTHQDGTVNLAGIDHAGASFSAQGVPFVRPGESMPNSDCCLAPAT